MKTYSSILLLSILACSVEIDEADIDESGDDSAIEGDVEFRAGPTFWEAEHIDKCCAEVDGEQTDTLCSDDTNNACVGFSTGGSITGWWSVNCYTCGTESTSCSNTRWIDRGLWGFECGGTAVKRSTNELIDDDCSMESCGPNNNYNVIDCQGICGEDDMDEGACQSGNMDKSTGMMCCTDSNAQNCILPAQIGGDEKCGDDTDTYAYWGNHTYTRETWCHPCIGTSTAHESDGGWDLISDPEDGDEYEQSVRCEHTLAEEVNPTYGSHPTRYACGGFAFLSTGVSFTETCANYP